MKDKKKSKEKRQKQNSFWLKEFGSKSSVLSLCFFSSHKFQKHRTPPPQQLLNAFNVKDP